MKRYFLTAIIALAACTSVAALPAGEPVPADSPNTPALRGKINPAGALRLRAKSAESAESYTTALIHITDSADTEALASFGVEILTRKGDIAVISLPSRNVSQVACQPSVRSLQPARPLSLSMKEALPATSALQAQQGVDLPHPFTGKGVIVGTMDVGIDPGHINFRDTDGSSRVKYFALLEETKDGVTVTTFGQDCDYPMEKFSTDTSKSYHGTHTLGTMAGGYKGMAQVAVLSEDCNSAYTEEMENPYYGVATEAEIAASGGPLYNSYIALAVSKLIDYAKEQGKPMVINLSLGDSLGPHDGSDLLSLFFDQCVAEDNAIICMSAGNEGFENVSYSGVFTESEPCFNTLIRPYRYASSSREGIIEVYSEDSTPLEVQFVIYDSETDTDVLTYPVEEEYSDEWGCVLSSESERVTEYDVVDPRLKDYFEGYFGRCYWMTDNERYCATVEMNLRLSANNPKLNGNKDMARYLPGLRVTGPQGMNYLVFCDSRINFDDYADQMVQGWQKGNPDLSISNIATSPNIIAVGSFNTGIHIPELDGSTRSYPYLDEYGKVSFFSSYGRLQDGRELPHVIAPGASIISSMNNYYVEDPGNALSNGYGEYLTSRMSVNVKEQKRNNFWTNELGTSMASPHVAGGIALWLEANPDLTAAEIRDIIARTATVDEDTQEGGIRAGAGKFNVYAGLKEALRMSSVHNLMSGSADSQLMLQRLGEGRYEVFVAGANRLECRIYTLSGQLLMNTVTQADQTVLDLSTLSRGLYLLTVNGRQAKILR